MKLVVGVDIGNSTTEACAAEILDDNEIEYLSATLARTTGIKGTAGNVRGVVDVVQRAVRLAGRDLADVGLVLINEATPVISGLAMETITETIITESTMIGHNPETPGGAGLGVGTTVPFAHLTRCATGSEVICVVPDDVDFDDAAAGINAALARGVDVQGAIVAQDDGNLIANRLARPIPIVDEVTLVQKVPLDMLAAVEVAAPGRSIRTLSNSYGIATIFELDAGQTRMIAPVARALVGNRSAVVIRTPRGDIAERVIPAGAINLIGAASRLTVAMDAGAAEIMAALRRAQPLEDASGEAGTHVGGMLARVRDTMADLTGQEPAQVRIRDVLAVDTFVPQQIKGGLAGELALQNAVALAAMVRTSKGPMDILARELSRALDVEIRIGGTEVDMAVLGALTTPGTGKPVGVLDLGGGSTDAALATRSGDMRSVHVAGAGDLVTKLIDSELGIGNLELAEEIKKFPLAKVESLFQVRLEDGTVCFYDDPLPAEVYARVVVLTDNGLAPVPMRQHSVEKIRQVRREAKRRVFVVNAVRALEQVAPQGNIRQIDFVVVLGGSALDFEIPDMIADEVAKYGIVCGIGNVRGEAGPRNAVATGLVASHARQAGG
jgi:diol dehydratase reactivase alpha subunit